VTDMLGPLAQLLTFLSFMAFLYAQEEPPA
jgi:hypothetical protein